MHNGASNNMTINNLGDKYNKTWKFNRRHWTNHVEVLGFDLIYLPKALFNFQIFLNYPLLYCTWLV